MTVRLTHRTENKIRKARKAYVPVPADVKQCAPVDEGALGAAMLRMAKGEGQTRRRRDPAATGPAQISPTCNEILAALEEGPIRTRDILKLVGGSRTTVRNARVILLSGSYIKCTPGTNHEGGWLWHGLKGPTKKFESYHPPTIKQRIGEVMQDGRWRVVEDIVNAINGAVTPDGCRKAVNQMVSMGLLERDDQTTLRVASFRCVKQEDE